MNVMSMPTQEAASISARLDQLPAAPFFWKLVILLSLGAFFEIYDLGLTGLISPGLISGGIFHTGVKGLFGLTDQATFAAVTFLGLFLGTVGFASIADRYGRRAIFTFSLLWYAAATVVMAMMNTAITVDAWRFIASVGIGVELVTIDAYLTELVPKGIRGRAFGVHQCTQFTAIPAVALLSWLLIPIRPFGIQGWRWLAMFPALGAVLVWWVRRIVPESPRWLATRGRVREAAEVMSWIEAHVGSPIENKVTDPVVKMPDRTDARIHEIFLSPFTRITVMLVLLNIFQAVGFYSFNNWVPALMESRGASFVKSLQYTFIIATLFPLSPLLYLLIADRIERKWQLVTGAAFVAVCGLGFSQQSTALGLITLGGLLTVVNGLFSCAYHTYQSELYPTRLRARAIGFVYSFSRLSTVFSSFMIAFFLQKFGTVGVFSFIALAELIVILSVGILGPRTRGRALEEISP